MAKEPYIKFYIGDYIKDTRILPLNVRGGWTDLILLMWNNDPKGEISGTIDEFARLMCCPLEEAILVIQTLKQKNIFGWEDIGNGILRIYSRKQKKMINLSKTRQNSGKEGGNPILVNQKVKKRISKNKKEDNLNPEYEYIIGTEVIKDKKGVQGEEKDWNKKPGEDQMGLGLPEIKEGATIQLMRLATGKQPTNEQVQELWDVFKKQNFTGENLYNSAEEVFRHFINWSKQQKLNGTGNLQSGGANSGEKLGTSAARIKTAKNW